MTQLSMAKSGKITEDMAIVASYEGLDPKIIRTGIEHGHIVIPKNTHHYFVPKGIGQGLKTKVNANLGTSLEQIDLELEKRKLDEAILSGTDSIMDLSTGGDLIQIRKMFLEKSPVMVGAVPIYQVASELASQGKPIFDMSSNSLFEIIEAQCAEGIDYITVHCGVTQGSYALAMSPDRITGIVSRGGALLAAWMQYNKKENPLYEEFDRLLKIAFAYDVTLSLGDGLRPGCVSDATDPAQIEELLILSELTKRARNAGVQVMIEGPGHVPLNQIETNIRLQKRLCHGAPFYVLGPLTTDCAPGYDHITAAIGGAVAAAAGADFLCYVTPAEHLCLPNIEDVRLGVISAKIAAHSGDIAKGIKGAIERDIQMSVYRKHLDWEGMFRMSIDSELPKKRRADSFTCNKNSCTMCGDLCAVNLHNQMCAKH
ncbi:MAG: phosphomethylpyrimidine synthase ThiC [Desulfobacterales bacterium]|nr:phosphomethylpyrimidine synthase ThiC [Desulfobacterales bacterium]